jgi:hypothetical protein
VADAVKFRSVAIWEIRNTRRRFRLSRIRGGIVMAGKLIRGGHRVVIRTVFKSPSDARIRQQTGQKDYPEQFQ